MINAVGYANKNSHSALKPFEFQRRNLGQNDVLIEIMFCGVCHSDVHQVRNEWKNTVYPCMPGHEIVGRVKKVGDKVKKYAVGDVVGVGCMVDSCHQCPSCGEKLENYCENGATGTYNGNMRYPSEENLTFGGYSNVIVAPESFVLKIPGSLKPAEAAPILCAGVTTYSPLKHWNIGKGKAVGVVGLGGLGHMAVQIAVALGAIVTVITTSPDKSDTARELGAHDVIDSTNKEIMKAREASLDFILSTIPESHDVNPYIALLKRDGILTVVGCLAPTAKPVDLSKMILDRKSIASSVIGSIAETQEVLDFCAKHNIAARTQIISIEDINEIHTKVDKGEMDFRYVIDMSTLKKTDEKSGLFEKLGLTG
ncbi:MAG: NAD(P)-dependent alcohol dehydrogenase [Alphaproteobacteria bacterium]